MEQLAQHNTIHNIEVTQLDPLANITYITSYQPPQRPHRTHTITLTATAFRPIACTVQAATLEPKAEAAIERPRGILTPKGKKGKKYSNVCGKFMSCTELQYTVNLITLQSRF